MGGVVRVELALPELPNDLGLKGSSWMLAGASSHRDYVGYFFMADGISKDPSLGQHFAKLQPNSQGKFLLELGVVLPDFFPSLDGKPEYMLDIAISDGVLKVCFSNVMARMRFSKNGNRHHAILPQRVLDQVGEQISFIPKDASVELLRTFATSRFEISGDSAEHAFESHCLNCVHTFIEALNRCLRALPFVVDFPGWLCSVAYTRESLPHFYFILQGHDEGQLDHGWIAPHIGKVAYSYPDLSSALESQFRGYVNGSIRQDAIDSLLYSAQTLLDGGVMEYVLLLSVIAAEVATQRFIRGRLVSAGVSNNKLKESEKDITYSVALNLLMLGFTPDEMKPDRELLGKMNRARSMRNEYMHEGVRPKPAEVVELFHATQQYIQYLRNLQLFVAGTRDL